MIGAGIVGTSLADELTARGWVHVSVVDRGPLFATGGSTSHAPGLVFQTNPSKTMTAFAVQRARASRTGGHSTRSVASKSPPPRKASPTCTARPAGQSWGIEGRLRTPAECVGLHPMIDRDRVLGGFHTPADGLTKALRAAEAQARRAESKGATLRPHTEVLGIVDNGRRVTGVRTPTASSTPTSWCAPRGSGARSSPARSGWFFRWCPWRISTRARDRSPISSGGKPVPFAESAVRATLRLNFRPGRTLDAVNPRRVAQCASRRR